ncbi:MAG: molybdenum cofactor guanylyltransferase [Chloroflexota bacterium]
MLTVVIQAGGESRRMGQDKALLSFLGRPLIERLVERLQPVAAELLITTNRPQAYAFLWLPLVQDRIPGRGALGGLYTALSAAGQPLVAVVACDMPFASPALLAAQRDALVASAAMQPAADIAIPRLPGGLEPFHAVYRRETCLPHIAAALEANRWRADSWFSQVSLRYFEEDELRRYEPDLRCFQNVNTPEEFAAAEARARREAGA